MITPAQAHFQVLAQRFGLEKSLVVEPKRDLHCWKAIIWAQLRLLDIDSLTHGAGHGRPACSRQYRGIQCRDLCILCNQERLCVKRRLYLAGSLSPFLG